MERGTVGPSLSPPVGVHSASVVAFANPVAWALDRLGFAFDARLPSGRCRLGSAARLMDVHPTMG